MKTPYLISLILKDKSECRISDLSLILSISERQIRNILSKMKKEGSVEIRRGITSLRKPIETTPAARIAHADSTSREIPDVPRSWAKVFEKEEIVITSIAIAKAKSLSLAMASTEPHHVDFKDVRKVKYPLSFLASRVGSNGLFDESILIRGKTAPPEKEEPQRDLCDQEDALSQIRAAKNGLTPQKRRKDRS